MKRVHSTVTTRPPPPVSALEDVSLRLGAIPPQLRDIYLLTDGAIGDSGVVLYAAAELVERNETYETATYAPGYIAIGDDGGGRVIIMSRDGSEILLVDAGEMEPKHGQLIRDTLSNWVGDGLIVPMEVVDHPSVVDVYLERPPPGGNRDVILLKRELGLTVGVGELAALCAKTPVRLLANVPFGKFAVRCRRINRISDCLTLRASGDPTRHVPMSHLAPDRT